MLYSRPLLGATYEVIIHPSSIGLDKKFDPGGESNPGPLDRELSVLTSRPGSYPLHKRDIPTNVVNNACKIHIDGRQTQRQICIRK